MRKSILIAVLVILGAVISYPSPPPARVCTVTVYLLSMPRDVERRGSVGIDWHFYTTINGIQTEISERMYGGWPQRLLEATFSESVDLQITVRTEEWDELYPDIGETQTEAHEVCPSDRIIEGAGVRACLLTFGYT